MTWMDGRSDQNEQAPCYVNIEGVRYRFTGLQTATAATTLVARAICRYRGGVFYTPYLDPTAHKGADGGTAALAIDALARAAVGADLDVHGGYTAVGNDLDKILGGLHCSVCRWLITVALHLHST